MIEEIRKLEKGDRIRLHPDPSGANVPEEVTFISADYEEEFMLVVDELGVFESGFEMFDCKL